MRILVSGSLAYDRIMDFPGYFSDHILPEKIHLLNVSFTVNGVVENFGGTAGNIAFALSLLGHEPEVLATIGRDHQRYFDWLEQNHILSSGIKVIEDEYTAGAYITTDRANNQITGFNPGAMKHPSCFSFADVSPQGAVVIIAPGNIQDMMEYSAACKARGIPYIFDPGQSLPGWDGQDLLRSLDGARVLVSNDYELELIASKTGLERRKLLGRAETVICTLGELGSRVFTRDGEVGIPTIASRGVVDPTGAGDAYRAGVIKGLIDGREMEMCALMGSVCASFAIEQYGTQEYRFSMEEFYQRLRDTSGWVRA